MLISFSFVNPRAFPKLIVNIVLSNDDGEACRPPEPNVLVDRKVSAADDGGDVGTAFAEALVPGPIGTRAFGNPRPPITVQSPTVPPNDGHGRKRLCLVVRWFDMIPQADQVMTQVELPPYRGPHGLFNLVAVEIVSKHNLRCFTE
jgi:hypothetical protein